MSSMEGLAERIAALAARVVESADSVDFMFGEVLTSEPLVVQVEQNLLLPAEVLVLTDPVIAAVEVREDVEGDEVVYRVVSKLCRGDRVLLAKVKGGEAYVVLSRCYQVVGGK